MLLQCCWRGSSSALPGAAFATHSSRSCSCQLSNNINKKVDVPHRGCTYGPQGLCRLSQGLSQYGDKYTKRFEKSQHPLLFCCRLLSSHFWELPPSHISWGHTWILFLNNFPMAILARTDSTDEAEFLKFFQVLTYGFSSFLHLIG